MKRPQHLTWEEAACYTLTLATAYRMLFGHAPHTLKPGDNVLVWGASGGLGVFGVQLCAASGANAIGVISDETKRDYVLGLGAKGVINRKDFNCWGQMPKVNSPEYDAWHRGGAQVRQGDLGHHRQEGRRHRVRASGRGDLPGLVPRGASAAAWWCSAPARPASTSPSTPAIVWMRQKRIQGSHFAHLKQASAANQFVIDRRDRPVHERGVPAGSEIPLAHTKMWKNQHAPGNMAVLVNAPTHGPEDAGGRGRRAAGVSAAD